MTELDVKRLLLENCKEVFSTMLGITITETSTHKEQSSLKTAERVLALIGFGGNYTGNCIISCSKALACRLASDMLGEQYAEPNGEVMDALGEISNMVFGNVKTQLEDHLGPLQLSIPTVIVGREFTVRNLANPSWIILPLRIDDEDLEARMCVSLNPGASHGTKLKVA